MTGDVNPDDYDDPTSPPPGYQAIPCPECGDPLLKSDTQRMAVGPVPGVGLARGAAVSFCPRCRGRRWVWYKIIDLER